MSTIAPSPRTTKKMLHKRAQQQKRDRRIQRAKHHLKVFLTTLALKGIKVPPEQMKTFERQAAKGKFTSLKRKSHWANEMHFYRQGNDWLYQEKKGNP